MHPSTRRTAVGGMLPRSPALTPNLSLPVPKPHRRSSLLSINSASSAPHTPRSCSSPSLPLPVYNPPPANTISAAKRNSTDSWNSSNADGDDMDVEWKNEHVLLLSRTLDALPAHLITPFNGPIPPSNLLDKIARGVSQAKGPADWPYSIRATRVKLLELARTRAREDAAAQRAHVRRGVVIMEEEGTHDINLSPNVDVDVQIDDEGSHYSYFHGGEEKPLSGVGIGIGPRRPLYRQSSMDFIKPGPGDLKDNPAIARLSTRLQRTDRIIANPSYHPYSRSRIPRAPAQDATNANPNTISTNPTTPTPTTNANVKSRPKVKPKITRSSSPPHKNDVPALITQSSSTPSSTTLDSFSSSSPSLLLSAAPRIVGLRMRRSASTMSISSGSLFSAASSNSDSGNGMPLADPRIQRVRRSDSFSVCSAGTPPVPPPKDGGYGYGGKQRAGVKRAPSYGALAQEVKAKVKSDVEVQVHVKSQVDNREKEKVAHTRQLSGSYPSSDEEEKARGVRAKKSRLMMGGGEGAVPPPSPSVVSSVPSSPARSGTGTGSGPSTPVVAKIKSGSVSPKMTPKTVSATTPPSRIAISTSKTRVSASKEKEEKEKVVDASKTGKSQTRTDKTDKTGGGIMNGDKRAELGLELITDVNMKTKTRRPPMRMNLQRNPSMFGAELPVVQDNRDHHEHARHIPSAAPVSPPATAGTKRQFSAPPPSYISSSSGKSRMRSPSPSFSPTLQPSLSPSLSRVHVHALGTNNSNSTMKGNTNANAIQNQNQNRAMHISTHAAPLSPSLADALTVDHDISMLDSPTLSPLGLAPALSPAPAYTSLSLSPKVRTLRRVRRLLAPARRISFGSLVAPGEEADGEGDGEGGGEDTGEWGCKRTGNGTTTGAGKMSLGSAFQLH